MASIINAATSGGLVTTADTSGILQLQTAGTTAVTVDASQNVGVGTTSPTARLTIPIPEYTASFTSGMIRFKNPDVAADSCFQTYYVTGAGSDVYIGSNSYIDLSGNYSRFSASYASSAINIRRDGNIDFATNTSAGAVQTRVTINAAGGLQCFNTISVGSATPSTSGAGITFPATQSASSDANTLDDYEEGTWTPNMTAFINVTGTPTFQSAKYTKIGNKCFFEAGISGLSVTTANIRTSFQVDYPVTAVSAYAVSGTAVSNNASGLGGFLATSTTTSAIYWETGTIIPSGGQAFQIGAWITTA